MTGKARRYSRWGGIGSGVITFVVLALLMAVLSLPGMGHYSGDSASDLWLFVGMCAIGATIVALIAGAAGWLIGGTLGALADRKTNQPEALGEGQPDFAAKPEAKVSEGRT